jgi:murein biosynthesis integral membrane protein MurJ
VNILLLATSYPGETGGLGAYVERLAEGLSRNGHDVDVAVRGRPTSSKPVASRAGCLASVRWAPSPRDLVRLISKSDVTHMNGFWLWPAAVALAMRKPLVWTHHEYDTTCPIGIGWYDDQSTSFAPGRCFECMVRRGRGGEIPRRFVLLPVRRAIALLARANVTPSAYMAARLALARNFVIEHGTEETELAGPGGEARPRFLFIGRLIPEKGCDLLVEAADLCRSAGVDVAVEVYGDGPERAALEDQVQSRGLESVVSFSGSIPRAEVASKLGRARAVVVPSRWDEVAGFVALESMAAGVPVIASRVGGLAELVDGVGVLVERGSTEALAAAMLGLARHPREAHALGRQARLRHRQKFRVERMIRDHEYRRTGNDVHLPTAGLAVASVSVLSLAFAYGREILIAHQFGASRVTDTFFVAYFTPQIIFQLLITGPLVWALTPLFAQVRLQDDEQANDRLAGGILTVAVATLGPLAAGWMLFADQVATVMAPFYGSSAKELTADLSRIMAPQLLTYGAGAVLTAVLYSRGRVLLPVLAQLINNVVLLILILFLKPSLGIHGVAVSVVVASGAFFLTLAVGVALTGGPIWPRVPRLGSHARRLATSVAPLVAISALSQVPGFAERAFASSLAPGELAGISYGYRLLQLALTAIGALTTVAFVGLAANAASHDREGFRTRVGENLRLNLKFGVLAMGALAVLAPLLVHVAYSGGRISSGDEHLIALTTAIAAVGLPFIGLIGALQQPLFAMLRWPVLAGLTVFYVAVNVPASAILIKAAGYRGFVAANLLALFAAGSAYVAYSWKRYDLRHCRLGRSLAQACVAAGVASCVLLALNMLAWNHGLGREEAALALGLSLAVYTAVVLIVLTVLREEVALALIAMIRRRLDVALLLIPRSKVSAEG